MSDPDPEVTAITKVNEALSGLEPAVVHRVLRWAADKFNVAVPLANKSRQPEDAAKNENPTNGEGSDNFADIASLYDSASPRTEAEKALVVGYWLQVVQGNSDWESFSVNKDLKNLGHGVGNITDALDKLIERTPRLVIQTRKSGTSRQARKRYKLTSEGIKKVKQMLSGASGDESENGGQG